VKDKTDQTRIAEVERKEIEEGESIKKKERVSKTND